MTKPLADFELAATGGQRFKLSAFAGHPFVLYFYPRDDTPGCTDEGIQFAGLNDEFKKAGYTIFGISRDTVASHEKFKKKLGFPFELLADPDESVCNQFGVMKDKNMYGKKVSGIERSTFVIGKDGSIVKEWRGVKVPNHAQEVLDALRTLG
jgi:thioredoxin-dependent peroxiredoxin